MAIRGEIGVGLGAGVPVGAGAGVVCGVEGVTMVAGPHGVVQGGGGAVSVTRSGHGRRAFVGAVRGLCWVEIWEAWDSGVGVWLLARSRSRKTCGGGGRGVGRGAACFRILGGSGRGGGWRSSVCGDVELGDVSYQSGGVYQGGDLLVAVTSSLTPCVSSSVSSAIGLATFLRPPFRYSSSSASICLVLPIPLLFRYW